MSWSSGRKRGRGLCAPICYDVSPDRGAKAAQKTLGNLLAGIQIALSQPILIDDVVVVEDEFGRIEDITLISAARCGKR